MVTINMMRLSLGWAVEVRCLSDDTKPTECTPPGVFPEKTMPIPNGTKLVEIDTGARFLFNEETSEWIIQPETEEEFAQDVVALKADMQEVKSDVGDLKSAINDPVTGLDTKAPVILETASGAIASFDDGADGMPLKSLTVNIEPVQSGSGDPSPTNVRPISGWTGCNIVHSPTTDAQDGTTYPITFPTSAGMVYGGTLDVMSGVLTVDRAMVDLGTLTWAYYNNGIFRTPTINGMKYIFFPNWLCSAYIIGYTTNFAGWLKRNNQIGFLEGYASIICMNTAYTDAASFTAAMNGQTLVYDLATPIEITLPSTQIDTLFGTNNIWADAGNVSVDYPADTKLYIDNIHKPTEDDMTADTQIASGKYFIIGNTLYKSTTLIPAGDTIIPGTNCTKTSLAEALNALNS